MTMCILVECTDVSEDPHAAPYKKANRHGHCQWVLKCC